MKDKIIVKNNIRVSKIIKTSLNYDEDLLISNDPKVINFLNKYSKYLSSCKEEDLLEFFKLTGLFIGHIYIETKEYKRIYFSCNGPYSLDYNLENIVAFNNHIIIETYVDDLKILKRSITANNKEIYKLKDNILVDVDYYKLYLNDLNINERVTYLKENNYLFPSNKQIKYILLDPLNNVLLLTKNKELYINDILYSNNVDYIFELNNKNIMFIYNDNVIEEYCSNNISLITKKYDKVLYTKNFVATLSNKITYNEEGIKQQKNTKSLCLYTSQELDQSKNIYMRFDEVTDIKYNKEKDELIIIKNKEEIILPLFSIYLLN
jgi:hypothetical protein